MGDQAREAEAPSYKLRKVGSVDGHVGRHCGTKSRGERALSAASLGHPTPSGEVGSSWQCDRGGGCEFCLVIALGAVS